MARTIRLLVLMACLALPGAIAAQQNAVSWLLLDVPPSMILDGPYQGQGNIDKIRQFFVSQLPAWDHQIEVGNIERVTRELSGTRQVVSPGLLLTPDRQRQFTVSIPEAIIPSNMLVIRKERLPEFRKYLDGQGEIDLGALLASPLRVGVALGRRYSGPVDALLAQHKDSPNLVVRTSGDISEGLVKMLVTERLDGSLLFPFEAQYAARQLGAEKSLVSLPIKGMPPFNVTVAAAPRTPWGEAFIEKLNVLIRANRQNLFVDALIPWLDEGAIKLYRQRAAEYFAAYP